MYAKYARSSISFLLILIFQTFLNAGGFEAGTLVLTPQGHRPIEHLRKNNTVTCWIPKSLPQATSIKCRRKRQTDNIVYLRFDNNFAFKCYAKQYFLLHKVGQLIRACHLQAGDTIATTNGPITVASKQEISQSLRLYELSLRANHTYFVTEYSILTHNAVFVIPLVVFGGGAAEFAGWSAIGAALVGGLIGAGVDKLQKWHVEKENRRLQGIYNQDGEKAAEEGKDKEGFDREKLLPTDGNHPYNKPKKHKGKDLPKDKEGRFTDDQGRGWEWDHGKKEWDVQIPSRGGTNNTYKCWP